MLDDLIVQAQRFDDDALAHLANKGLVRRATKLASTTAIRTDHHDQATAVLGDDWRVDFAANGSPADGSCGCATAGVCQHLIAAIIYLRQLATNKTTPDQDPVDDNDQDQKGDQPQPGEPTLQETIVGLDEQTLRTWATTAALRWADERLVDLDLDRVTVTEATNLTIDLPPPHGSIRFIGSDLDQALVKPSGNHDQRRIVLAVLALWARAGRTGPAIERTATKPTELGRERHAVATRAANLAESLLAIGLLHLTDADRERLDSLAASARGAKLYRLSLQAERAADQVAALNELAPEADTQTLLDQLSELAVVAETISCHLADDKPLREALTGRARARYENIGSLRLAGLGTYSWGDHRFAGQTAVFLDQPDRAFTLTRPTMASGTPLDTTLDWAGVGSVGQLTGHWTTITNAAVSDDNRLSAANSSSATIDTPLTSHDLDALAWDGQPLPTPSHLWKRAADHWRVLTVEEERSPIEFDGITQRSIWPIRSRQTDVTVVLAHRKATELMGRNLNTLAQSGTVTHIIGRLRATGPTAEAWPISAVSHGTLIDLSNPPRTQPTNPTIGSLLRQLVTPHQSSTDSPGPEREVENLQTDTERLRTRLLSLAERGTRPTNDQHLHQLADTADGWGFPVLAQTLTTTQQPAQAILRASWTLRILVDTTTTT